MQLNGCFRKIKGKIERTTRGCELWAGLGQWRTGIELVTFFYFPFKAEDFFEQAGNCHLLKVSVQ